MRLSKWIAEQGLEELAKLIKSYKAHENVDGHDYLRLSWVTGYKKKGDFI